MADTDAGPLRHRDLRQPDDPDDGPAAPPGRRRGPRPAARPGRRAARASTASALAVADGAITHPPTGRSLGFGDLTEGRRLVETIETDDEPTPADRWEVAGRSVPKVDGRDFVTGPAPLRLGRDPARDAPRQGPPAAGLRRDAPTSLDASAAEAIAGRRRRPRRRLRRRRRPRRADRRAGPRRAPGRVGDRPKAIRPVDRDRLRLLQGPARRHPAPERARRPRGRLDRPRPRRVGR